MGVNLNPQNSGVRTPDEKWFPRAVMPAGGSRLLVFCFPGAGMEASIYTGTGTSLSPMPNPLCDFARKEGIGVLGVQLPFRGARRKEEHPRSIQMAAKMALDAMRPLIEKGNNIPFILIGYSMGAWIAYEVLCLLQQQRMHLPLHFVAAAMVSPDLPIHLRPWQQTANLDKEGFQKQLRAWSCNEILFTEDMWIAYEPLLRNDHLMLDNYIYTPINTPINIPLSVFRGEKDKQLADASLFSGWFKLLQNNPDNCSSSSSSSSSSSNSSSSNDCSSNNNDCSSSSSSNGCSTNGCSTNGSISPNSSSSTDICSSTNVNNQNSSSSSSNSNSNSSSSNNNVVSIPGDHGLVYNAIDRAIFFNKIVEVLDSVLLRIEYGQ